MLPLLLFISSLTLLTHTHHLFLSTSLHQIPITFFSCSTSTPAALLLFLCLQARWPSRPSGLSPVTSLCGWEAQLCWGVRCSGPQGLCSGWKMASSWDFREACQAFHATAWLETPREVNRDTDRIRSMAFWVLIDLSKLNKLICFKITKKYPGISKHKYPLTRLPFYGFGKENKKSHKNDQHRRSSRVE